MGSPGPSPRPAVVSELLSVSEGALPPPLVVEGAGGDTNNPSKKCIDSPPPPTSHPTITSVLAGAPSSVVGGTEGLPVEDLSSEENVTDVVFCPLNRVGALIGKKGVVIRDLCTRSRCSIRVLKNDDKLGQETTGAAVTVSGRAGDVIEGKTLVEQVIRDGYNSLPRQLPVPGSIRGTMKVSRDKVGRVIGRGGWVVRSLEHHCRVKVEIDDVALEAGASASAEKVIALTGTSEGVEAAKQAIQQVLAHGASALPWYEDSSHWRGTRWERQSIAVLCPKNQIGRIIGRGGGTVKQLQHISGARISVSYLDEPAFSDGDAEHTRILISGNSASIEHCIMLMQAVLHTLPGNVVLPLESEYQQQGGQFAQQLSVGYPVSPCAGQQIPRPMMNPMGMMAPMASPPMILLEGHDRRGGQVYWQDAATGVLFAPPAAYGHNQQHLQQPAAFPSSSAHQVPRPP